MMDNVCMQASPDSASDSRNTELLLKELAVAKRAGNLDAMARITQLLLPQEPPPSPKSTTRSTAAPPALRQELLDQEQQLRAALDNACPDAAPDEKLLNRLVAGEIPLILALQEIERRLSARMLSSLDDAQFSVALARSMGDTLALSSTLTKRVQGTLTTAAALRAQRRMLERGDR
jgi:hypothetical protein